MHVSVDRQTNNSIQTSFLQLSLTKTELVRKNVDSLTPEEILSLQRALGEVTADTSEKGYAAIAAYHGYPPQCQLNGKNMACCVHGSQVFPWWHRLYTVQMEQALKEKGQEVNTANYMFPIYN